METTRLAVVHRLLMGLRVKDVARDVGVSVGYVSTIKNSDDFKLMLSRYDAMIKSNVVDMQTKIELASHEALYKIIERMRGSSSEALELKAAEDIMSYTKHGKPAPGVLIQNNINFSSEFEKRILDVIKEDEEPVESIAVQ